MAIIEFTLSPAWKRVETDEDLETEPEMRADEMRDDEPPVAESVDERVVEDAVAEAVDEELPAPEKRRLLTLRRVLALGVVVGAVALARRMRRRGDAMVDEASIDVETPDEAEIEQ